jgi:protein-tyrosine phosphatase
VLAGGGLVVFPTETVYGVAARADRREALERLREVKGRPASKPFTVHVGRREEVDRYVPVVSGIGRRLIRRGWPGPLTILFPVDDETAAPIHAEIGAIATKGLYRDGWIGIRCPGDDRARDLLNGPGCPIVAASANAAGQPAPRNVAEALRDLDGQVDLVLDGGPTRLSVPSTIVRLSASGFEIVRKGIYDESSLRRMAMLTILFICTGNTCRSPMAAALCRKLLAERLGGPDGVEARGIAVRSCGVFAVEGAPASPEAVAVMSQRGADLSRHRSAPLTADVVRQADHIFAMTQSHVQSVLSAVPSAADRCRRLCDEDVADPIGGSAETYARCADEIEAGLQARLKEVEL